MAIEWNRVEPTETTKVGWRTIVTKHFQLPDGRTDAFQLYAGKDTACIIAVTKDRQVITVLQFRPGPEKIMHEIPGGFVDEEGGSPEHAAVRELSEETGYTAGKVTYLGLSVMMLIRLLIGTTILPRTASLCQTPKS